MKLSIIHYIPITTFILCLVTILATLNYAFSWVFYLTVFG